MSSEKITIQKLKGASNYEVWSLRTESYLIKEGLIRPIQEGINNQDNEDDNKALANIKLLLEDGPLLQIQHITSAKSAWDTLKNLYSPKGFTSEFLICKEFFETNLERFNSMEEYLNKVKQLSDQLKAKNLELPIQVIIAWVLNNLTDAYDSIVSNITQSLRNNKEAYNLESLFANLLDESKRQDSKDDNKKESKAFYTTKTYKGKKPYKITKGKYCKHCKQLSHNTDNCFFLFPDKAPKSWKEKSKDLESSSSSNNTTRENNKAQEERDNNIDALYSNINMNDLVEMPNLDYEQEMVFITIQKPRTPITNNSTGDIKCILDTAAS